MESKNKLYKFKRLGAPLLGGKFQLANVIILKYIVNK